MTTVLVGSGSADSGRYALLKEYGPTVPKICDLAIALADNGAARHSLLHTDGGTVAWVGSTSEFYKPLRECRQKLSLLVTREITQSLKPQTAKYGAGSPGH